MQRIWRGTVYGNQHPMVFNNNKEFKTFFEAYFEPVYRFAKKYTEEDAIARDIAQETFIRLYERRTGFDAPEKAKSFAYATAHHLCLDYLKHHKITQQYSRYSLEEEEKNFFLHEITYQETLRLLHQAIAELPQQTRTIILLGLEGRNNQEIAESLNISVNTVKTLKKSAYKRLREVLGKEFFFFFTLLLG